MGGISGVGTNRQGGDKGTLSTHDAAVFGLAMFSSAALNNLFVTYYLQLYCDQVEGGSFYFAHLVFMVWNSLNDPLFGWLSDNLGSGASPAAPASRALPRAVRPALPWAFLLPPWHFALCPPAPRHRERALRPLDEVGSPAVSDRVERSHFRAGAPARRSRSHVLCRLARWPRSACAFHSGTCAMRRCPSREALHSFPF